MILDGFRVIDFSQYIPGSYASFRLVELGAEVIKVEPLTGDPAREFGKIKEEKGIVFAANNRNKKSITLNLKTREGQGLAKELIKETDVVMESFRPGVMEKFGLDYKQMKEIKPDIIYLSLSGYGQHGSMSRFGSHDLNYQALSGVLSQLKDQQGKPILPSLTLADIVGGMVASERILGSLLQRAKTGKGEYLDLALMDAVFSLMNTHIVTDKLIGKDNVISQLDGELISYNIYETKDGRFVSLAALEPKFWINFCQGVNREDWIPAHLTTQIEDNPVFHQLTKLFRSRTLEEWSRFSLEVDCCLTPILEVDELESHPYILENGLISNHYLSPALGEHTEELLTGLLHKTGEEIAVLRGKGVI